MKRLLRVRIFCMLSFSVVASLGCGRHDAGGGGRSSNRVDADSRSEVRDSTDRKRILVEQLLETRNVAVLAELLAQNPAAADVDMIRGIGGPVETAERIQSGGRWYVTAIASRSAGAARTGPQLAPDPQIAIVFDAQGNCLTLIGGRVGPDGVNGDQVQVLNLGTTDTWFVLVFRNELQESFTQRTAVYILREHFPCAVLANHHGMAFTQKPQDFGSIGAPYLLFDCPAKIAGAKTDGVHNAAQDPSPIRWNSKVGVFEGRSHCAVGGVECYAIDLAASEAFEAKEQNDDTSQ